jgi:hypothetical protein
VRLLRLLARRSSWALTLLACIAPPLRAGGADGVAATSSASAATPPRPHLKQLRYDEDYRFLRDPARRTELLDPLKFIPLDDDGSVYLTLGGEVRSRWEYFHESLWGQGPQDDNGYLLQRIMLHADLHVGEHLRLFAQLKSGLCENREGGPRPPDRDELDLHQAFFDVAVGDDALGLTVRVGRQELQYGSSRLISFREGPNVRQSFDGVRLILKGTTWRVDLLGARPVPTEPGVFDDGWDTEDELWGVYATGALGLPLDAHGDLYYLGLDRREARFVQGTHRELRHSFGARLWGKPAPFDYDLEAVWQTGRFGSGRIEAWTVASDLGFTVADAPLKPRVSLKADVASGDGDPGTRGLQTFDALFPRGAYFSETALVGPANFYDVHPCLEVHPIEPLTLGVDWDFFWLQSTGDGLYNVATKPIRGVGRGARRIGSQLQVQAELEVAEYLSFGAIYAHFFPGHYLAQTGPSEAVDYVTAWATFKF